MESTASPLHLVADTLRDAADHHSSEFFDRRGLFSSIPGPLALFDGSWQQARDYFAQPKPSGPLPSPLLNRLSRHTPDDWAVDASGRFIVRLGEPRAGETEPLDSYVLPVEAMLLAACAAAIEAYCRKTSAADGGERKQHTGKVARDDVWSLLKGEARVLCGKHLGALNSDILAKIFPARHTAAAGAGAGAAAASAGGASSYEDPVGAHISYALCWYEHWERAITQAGFARFLDLIPSTWLVRRPLQQQLVDFLRPANSAGKMRVVRVPNYAVPEVLGGVAHRDKGQIYARHASVRLPSHDRPARGDGMIVIPYVCIASNVPKCACGFRVVVEVPLSFNSGHALVFEHGLHTPNCDKYRASLGFNAILAIHPKQTDVIKQSAALGFGQTLTEEDVEAASVHVQETRHERDTLLKRGVMPGHVHVKTDEYGNVVEITRHLLSAHRSLRVASQPAALARPARVPRMLARLCICGETKDGAEWISCCHGTSCSQTTGGWHHLGCVDLEKRPDESWVCPGCVTGAKPELFVIEPGKSPLALVADQVVTAQALAASSDPAAALAATKGDGDDGAGGAKSTSTAGARFADPSTEEAGSIFRDLLRINDVVKRIAAAEIALEDAAAEMDRGKTVSSVSATVYSHAFAGKAASAASSLRPPSSRQSAAAAASAAAASADARLKRAEEERAAATVEMSALDAFLRYAVLSPQEVQEALGQAAQAPSLSDSSVATTLAGLVRVYSYYRDTVTGRECANIQAGIRRAQRSYVTLSQSLLLEFDSGVLKPFANSRFVSSVNGEVSFFDALLVTPEMKELMLSLPRSRMFEVAIVDSTFGLSCYNFDVFFINTIHPETHLTFTAGIFIHLSRNGDAEDIKKVAMTRMWEWWAAQGFPLPRVTFFDKDAASWASWLTVAKGTLPKTDVQKHVWNSGLALLRRFKADLAADVESGRQLDVLLAQSPPGGLCPAPSLPSSNAAESAAVPLFDDADAAMAAAGAGAGPALASSAPRTTRSATAPAREAAAAAAAAKMGGLDPGLHELARDLFQPFFVNAHPGLVMELVRRLTLALEDGKVAALAAETTATFEAAWAPAERLFPFVNMDGPLFDLFRHCVIRKVLLCEFHAKQAIFRHVRNKRLVADVDEAGGVWATEVHPAIEAMFHRPDLPSQSAAFKSKFGVRFPGLVEYLEKNWLCPKWAATWSFDGRCSIPRLLINTTNPSELLHRNIKQSFFHNIRQVDMVFVLTRLLGLRTPHNSLWARQIRSIRHALTPARPSLPDDGNDGNGDGDDNDEMEQAVAARLVVKHKHVVAINDSVRRALPRCFPCSPSERGLYCVRRGDSLNEEDDDAAAAAEARYVVDLPFSTCSCAVATRPCAHIIAARVVHIRAGHPVVWLDCEEWLSGGAPLGNRAPNLIYGRAPTPADDLSPEESRAYLLGVREQLPRIARDVLAAAAQQLADVGDQVESALSASDNSRANPAVGVGVKRISAMLRKLEVFSRVRVPRPVKGAMARTAVSAGEVAANMAAAVPLSAPLSSAGSAPAQTVTLHLTASAMRTAFVPALMRPGNFAPLSALAAAATGGGRRRVAATISAGGGALTGRIDDGSAPEAAVGVGTLDSDMPTVSEAGGDVLDGLADAVDDGVSWAETAAPFGATRQLSFDSDDGAAGRGGGDDDHLRPRAWGGAVEAGASALYDAGGSASAGGGALGAPSAGVAWARLAASAALRKATRPTAPAQVGPSSVSPAAAAPSAAPAAREPMAALRGLLSAVRGVMGWPGPLAPEPGRTASDEANSAASAPADHASTGALSRPKFPLAVVASRLASGSKDASVFDNGGGAGGRKRQRGAGARA